MRDSNLAALDVNLLVVLDALLSERHVTRAATRLGLTQSAASHALARLRTLLGDPLLVRDRQALVLTPRAEALAAPLGEALRALRLALEPPTPFDPATSTRTFTLAMADYAQLVLLPPLLRRLAKTAPGIDLIARDFVGELFDDTSDPYDFAVAPDRTTTRSHPTGSTNAAVRERRLFRERFVCVARRGHPAIGAKLDLATFVALPHAFVAPRGTPGGIVDDVLAERGLTRRVALMVQHFLVAPYAVASSELIITLAERLARTLTSHLPLTIHEPPLTIPRFTMQLYWHERMHREPAHAWLRQQIIEVAKEL